MYVIKLNKIIMTIMYIVLCTNTYAESELPRDRLLPLLKTLPVTKIINNIGRADIIFRVYKDKNFASVSYGVELCILEIPIDEVNLGIVNTDKKEEIDKVYEKYTPELSIASITGSYYGFNHKGKLIPLGFIKSKGKVTNNKKRWKTGGIVLVNNNTIDIVPINKFKNKKSITMAIQSRPMLIENELDGIIHSNYDRFDRSIIAITTNGNLILSVISEPAGRAASLAELSTLLLNIPLQNKGRISWALAMDGGPGSHLYIPSLEKHCGSNIVNYVSNIVHVK